MLQLGILEALDVIKHIGHGLIPCPRGLVAILSDFSDEKMLSIATLSQTLLDWLIGQIKP